MSLEQAIISLSIEGLEAFTTANDKIQADLTSTERAGKSAESAAAAANQSSKEAERSARALQQQISKTISRLSAAVGLADRLATAAGVDPESTTGQAFDVAKNVLGGAAQGAQLGAAAGSIIPGVGTGLGALGGGAIGSIVGLAEGLARIEKKVDQVAVGPGRNDIESAVVRESIRARLDQAASGGVRGVQ